MHLYIAFMPPNELSRNKLMSECHRDNRILYEDNPDGSALN